MHVRRYNYPAQFETLMPSLVVDLANMLSAGDYILGPQVEAFERHFAEYLGVGHVVGVNSGTDALLLSLMALDIGPGAEVIVPANTFYATVAAICLAGARPVLVDTDAQTYLIDVAQVEAALTTRTRAVIPVHLYGKPVPMAGLLALADRHGLHILEDAAQSHGARRDGRLTGGSGVAGCFSFHPSKNLAAAGDAGAISTSDAALANRLRVLRALGQEGQNHHVALGFNSKLDALQARILSAKLPLLDGWTAARGRHAQAYRDRLKDTPLQFQSVDPDETHAYHLFQVRTAARDELMVWLSARGVEVCVRYPTPIHLQPAFAMLGQEAGRFPVAEALARELLCLPMRPDMVDAELDHVSDCVHAFFRGHR